MRDIKFRGKSAVNKWIYGWLKSWKHFNGTSFERVYSICDEENEHLVIPETIGQFTGLKDKNGKEIYEGDILKTESEKHMIVSWDKRLASFCLDREGWAFAHWFGESCEPEQTEVIGNIHQNPSLLK